MKITLVVFAVLVLLGVAAVNAQTFYRFPRPLTVEHAAAAATNHVTRDVATDKIPAILDFWNYNWTLPFYTTYNGAIPMYPPFTEPPVISFGPAITTYAEMKHYLENYVGIDVNAAGVTYPEVIWDGRCPGNFADSQNTYRWYVGDCNHLFVVYQMPLWG